MALKSASKSDTVNGCAAQRRRLAGAALTAALFAVSTPAGAASWDGLISNSHWYVPLPGLLGYAVTRSDFSNPVPLGDQTLWSLGPSVDGVFGGTSTATIQLGPRILTDQSTINGRVSEDGSIVMIFTPEGGGQATVGLGRMRAVGSTTAMEMQMITGTQLLVTHWASMLPYDPARFSPPAAQTIPVTLASGQWAWTDGTAWRVTSPTLFGGIERGRMAVDGFTNGYFQGTAAAAGGRLPVTLLGSITPGGQVLLATTNGVTVNTLYGSIAGGPADAGMRLESYDYVTGAFSGVSSTFSVVAPFDATVAAAGRPGAAGAARALYALAASPISFTPALAPAFDSLLALDGARLAEAVTATTPALSGSAAALSYEMEQSFADRLAARMRDGTAAGMTAWFEPFGATADQSVQAGYPGYRWNSRGVALGMEARADGQFLLGLGFGTGSLDADGDHDDTLDVHSNSLGVYGLYDFGAAGRFDFVLDGGLTENAVSRRLAFADLTTGGSYDGRSYHAGVGWSFDIAAAPDLRLAPRFGLDYGRTDTDGYAEAGGSGLGLVVDADSYESLRLGADLDARLAWQEDLFLTGRIGARYETLGEGRSVTSRFAAGGPSFETSSGSPSPWLFSAGLGLSAALGTGTSLTAAYGVEASPSGYVEQSASLRLHVSF